MRDFASFNGFKRLFSFTAIAAVCLTVLVLTGCGHKCSCNSCHSGGCSTCNTCQHPTSCTTCNTCNTCSVEATPSSTCTTCNIDRVSQAPASLSEQRTYATPTFTAPSYSTGSNFTQTNTTLDRTGDTRELPVFSAPVAQTPPPVAAPVQAYQPPPAAAQILPEPTRSGGQYHTLQQGETVYALSRKYGVKARTILDANHFNDPNHLSVGTKVYIPAN